MRPGQNLARKRAYVLGNPLARQAIQQQQLTFGDIQDVIIRWCPGSRTGDVPVSEAVGKFSLGNMQRPCNFDHWLGMLHHVFQRRWCLPSPQNPISRQ